MTWAEEQDLCRLVRWRLRGWKQHEDWEDIYSEGLLLAWRSYQGSEGQPHSRRVAWAVGASRYAYNQWCRRWYGQEGNTRTESTVRRSRPEVSLEALSEARTGGFENRLLNRLEARWLRQRVAAICTPKELEVIEALIVKGESQRGAAARMGITRSAVECRYESGIRKCRERLG